MTTSGFNGQSFQTAAARRAGERIKFELSSWVYDEPDSEDDPGREVTVQLMIDPRLDIIRLGAAFAGLGKALEAVGKGDVSDEDKVAMIDRETPRAREKLRDLLVPPSRTKFDTVKETVDLQMIGSVVQWVTKELSGLDPTRRPSSSTGSDTDSTSSTDGAPPED